MYGRLLKNDFRKNPVNSTILILFMTLSVTVAVTVTLLVTQLITSINTMYETARPPHFLQMHKGKIDLESIRDFNETQPDVLHWQVVPMVDVYGDELSVVRDGEQVFSLEDCRLDISLVRQNEGYDVLLNADREPLVMRDGEIGVPKILLGSYDIRIGDVIALSSGPVVEHYRVAAYVYDGQMNSTLCSSTRFLLSDNDFEELFGKAGETEYLIETYLTDQADASSYQNAYESCGAGLPSNGQAITYHMIFLLSAMTDLMMAVVLILAGVLLIALSFLCLRYTIYAQMEDEQKEIGTMKAMGIPGRGIRGIYLCKIAMVMSVGSVLGFLLAFALRGIFSVHMRETFGEQKLDQLSVALAVIMAVLLFGIVLGLSGNMLKRLGKAAIVDLLVTQKGFGKENRVKDGLHACRRLSVNVKIGLLVAGRGYGMILGLGVLTTILLLLPARVVTMMSGEGFGTYMGVSPVDAFVEIGQSEGMEEAHVKAAALLSEEKRAGVISEYSQIRTIRVKALGSDGKISGVPVKTGEAAGEGLKYLEGSNPQTDTQIALSLLMAEELSKQVGDELTIYVENQRQDARVCGVYQDLTSGGRTAMMTRTFAGTEAEKYGFQLYFTDKMGIEEIMERYRSILGAGVDVESMDTFVGQTLGQVTLQIKRASHIALAIGMFLALFMTVLCMQLRLTQNAGEIAVKRAMGIPYAAIIKQELYPVLLNGAVGILAGMLFTNSIGNLLVSGMFEVMGLGIQRLDFAPLTFLQTAGIPLCILGMMAAAVRISCLRIGKTEVCEGLLC